MNKIKDREHTYLKELFESIHPTCNNITDYLFLSNFYIAVKEKLYFKLKHIQKKDCNWLSKKTIKKCNSFLHYYLVGNNYTKDEKKNIQHEINIIENEDNKHIKIDSILQETFHSRHLV